MPKTNTARREAATSPAPLAFVVVVVVVVVVVAGYTELQLSVDK